jgi:hypothetical protein
MGKWYHKCYHQELPVTAGKGDVIGHCQEVQDAGLCSFSLSQGWLKLQEGQRDHAGHFENRLTPAVT